MGRVAVLPCPLSSFGGSRLSLFHLPPSPSCYCFRFSVSLGLGLSELAFSISQSRSSSPSVRGESLLSLILSLSLSCRSLGFRTELSPKSVGGEGLKASAPRSGLVNSARVFAVISLCLRPRFTPPQMSQRRQQAVAKSHVPTDVAAFHPMPPPPPPAFCRLTKVCFVLRSAQVRQSPSDLHHVRIEALSNEAPYWWFPKIGDPNIVP